MKLLIVEDDRDLRNGLCDLLQAEGYETLAAADGVQGLELFTKSRPDFCVLDVMMPGMDGFELCRRIRQLDEGVPVLFLSAREEETDHVVGLELGADDFVVKPFKPRELVARIRAIARRRVSLPREVVVNRSEPPDSFDFGPCTVDAKSLRVLGATGAATSLSRRELMILWVLKAREGEVVTRDTLFDLCWGRDYLPSSRALDQQISVLRRKLDLESGHASLIQTVHGEGYRYEQ